MTVSAPKKPCSSFSAALHFTPHLETVWTLPSDPTHPPCPICPSLGSQVVISRLPLCIHPWEHTCIRETRTLSLEQQAVCILEMTMVWRMSRGSQVGAVGGILASQLSNVEMGEALICLSPHQLPGNAGWTTAGTSRTSPLPWS